MDACPRRPQLLASSACLRLWPRSSPSCYRPTLRQSLKILNSDPIELDELWASCGIIAEARTPAILTTTVHPKHVVRTPITDDGGHARFQGVAEFQHAGHQFHVWPHHGVARDVSHECARTPSL